ncbi:hypothetical protein OPV22_014157 [Ensete ventricosum]|uniref:Uncharacterized protein n=1 Tax=Ensete ventricosum TaxID=4639 RepID=A0AAV8RBA5_ENSVE|nr:hypothetical protein OPV22_014157 [Ensete ventricosum]
MLRPRAPPPPPAPSPRRYPSPCSLPPPPSSWDPSAIEGSAAWSPFYFFNLMPLVSCNPHNAPRLSVATFPILRGSKVSKEDMEKDGRSLIALKEMRQEPPKRVG